MSTISVLHVIARMNVGGTSKYVGDLVQNIPNSALATGYVQGAEIEDSRAAELNPFRISHLGRRISLVNDFKAWRELRTLIRELKPEIVHTHTFKAGLIGRLVPGNHKRVHTFHGHLLGDQSFNPLEKLAITFIERYLANGTDLLISVGEKVGAQLRTLGIGTSMRWVSIPPGVSSLSVIDKKKARKILGLPSEGLIIGWMARMTSVKNPLLALEVAKQLPNHNFAMAGGGDLLETIANIAPANVIVIGWADAALFWSAVDCALSTSENEGIPIALIEAQIAGIPVVATNVGSIEEVIEDQVTGFVTSNDIEAIEFSLKELLSDPHRMQSMALAAANSAVRKFELKKMIDTHSKIYVELIATDASR